MRQKIKGLWRILFQLLYSIQDIQIKSYTSVIIYFLIKTCFGITLLALCRLGSGKIYPNVIKLIDSYVFFIEQKLKVLNYSISISLIVIIFIYILLLVKKIFDKKSKQLSQICGILTIAISAFIIPISTISSQLILYGITNKQTQYIIMGGIIITFILLFTIIYDTFYIGFSFKSDNNFSKFYNIGYLVSSIILLSLSFYISIRVNINFMEALILNCLALFSLFIRIYISIFRTGYLNEDTQKINILSNLLQFNIILFLTLDLILKQSEIQNNFIIVISILTIFQFLSATSYKKYKTEGLVFINPQQIKDERTAINYLSAIFILAQPTQQTHQGLILTSLLKEHTMKCSKIECYCQQAKDKTIQVTQITKHLILQKVSLLQAQMKSYLKVQILGCFFQLQTFEYYPQLLPFMKKISQLETSIEDSFGRYCLEISVKKLIIQKNIQIKILNVQSILQLESLLKLAQDKIIQTCQSQLKKYKYLQKCLCRQTQVEKDCQKQLVLIKQIVNLYKCKQKKFQKSMQFNQVFYFYFSKILFLSSLLNKIQANVMQGQIRVRINQLIDLNQFSRLVFHPKSCVVQSPVDPKSMGKISRASKNLTHIFGYQRTLLVGNNINKLMPSFMGEQHQIILSNWMKTGTWRTIGKLKQIFCVHKKQYCFSALIYLKLRTSFDGLVFVTTVFQKNENDFLILDDKNVVIGLGCNFVEIVGQNCKNIPIQFLIHNFENIKYMGLINQKKLFKTKINSLKLVSHLIQDYNRQKHSIDQNTLKKQFLDKLKQQQVQESFIQVQYHISLMRQKKFMVFYLCSACDSYGELKTLKTQGNFQLSGSSSETGNAKIQSAKQRNMKKNLQNEAAAGASSITNSSANENYALKRTLGSFFQYFLDSSIINDPRINFLTFFMFLITFFLIGIIFAVQFFYTSGLNQINQILFADGAVSDNMQLTQFLYNNVMLMKQYQANGSEVKLNSVKMSGEALQIYLYSLMTMDMEYLFSNVTQVRQQPYYEYLKVPQTWIFPKGGKTQIESNQFLQYYYYAAKNALSTGITDEALNLMLINFPEMKRINHQNLFKYYDMCLNSIKLLDQIFITNILLFLLLSSILGYLLHRFLYFRYRQSTKILKTYGLFKVSQFQALKDYYALMYQYLSIMRNNFHISTKLIELEVAQNEYSHSQMAKLDLLHNKRYFHWIWIVLIIILASSVNISVNLRAKSVFVPSKQVTIAMNNLMDSQNYLLQIYFDLKAYYLISNQSQPIETVLKSLIKHIDSDQVVFNQISASTIQLISQYDTAFQSQFIRLLVQDVCLLDKNVLSSAEIQKCQKQMSYNILKIGVMAGMTVFQREVRDTLEQFLHNQTVLQGKNQLEHFYQTIYQDIDMYQSTQQRILISLGTIIANYMSQNLIFVILETLAIFFILVGWVFSLQYQKKNLGESYGNCLLIPPCILKENKKIIHYFENVIQYVN